MEVILVKLVKTTCVNLCHFSMNQEGKKTFESRMTFWCEMGFPKSNHTKLAVVKQTKESLK